MKKVVLSILVFVAALSQAHASGDLVFPSPAMLSLECSTENGEQLSIKLYKSGGAVVIEDGLNIFSGFRGSWKEPVRDTFQVNVRGLPMIDPWSEFSAAIDIKLSSLGSFAQGSYNSGTRGGGFEKVGIECIVDEG